MKKLTILLFSILISFNSYGEWTEVAENTTGDSFYIDNNTIKKHNGYTYYWELTNFKEPIGGKYFSTKSYVKMNCELGKRLFIQIYFYNKPMGNDYDSSYTPDEVWDYIPPGSTYSAVSRHVCNYPK
jgi:hypothetical protein